MPYVVVRLSLVLAKVVERHHQRAGVRTGSMQRRTLIAGRRGYQRGVQVAEYGRIEGGRALVAAGFPGPHRNKRRVGRQVKKAPLDGRYGNHGGACYLHDAPVADLVRLRRDSQPARSLRPRGRRRHIVGSQRGLAHVRVVPRADPKYNCCLLTSSLDLNMESSSRNSVSRD